MKQTRDKTSPDQAAMPQEFAGAVNLMAHPMAGAAAAGALGLGFASHAFGMWLGAMAGAAEASRAMLASLPEADTAPRPAPKVANLKLVVSKPAASKAATGAARGKAAPERPVPMAKPDVVDDLKAISGIGPKLEKVLNDLGIWTYGQVSALSSAEIAWLDDHLGFSGRIGRDDWAGQARALSGGA